MDNRYPVPRGFRTLLECLAREVLRSQPKDIYRFSALFFQKLLQLREEVGFNPIDNSDVYDQFKQLLSEEAFQQDLIGPNSTAAKLRTYQNDMTEPNPISAELPKPERVSDVSGAGADLDEAATKIQSHVKGYLTREKIYQEHPELEEHLKHQHHEGVSPAKTPEHHNPPGENADLNNAAKSPAGDADAHYTAHHELSTPEHPDLDKAATKIQAQIRGFVTREKIYREHPELEEHLKHQHAHPHHGAHDMSTPEQHDHELVNSASGDVDLDKAATKIQSQFRGHVTREKMYHEHPELEEHVKHHHVQHEPPSPTKTHAVNIELDNIAKPLEYSYPHGIVDAQHTAQHELNMPEQSKPSGDSDNLTEGYQELESPGKSPEANFHAVNVDLDEAATKIQSQFRGFKTREKIYHEHPQLEEHVKQHHVHHEAASPIKPPEQPNPPGENLLGIDEPCLQDLHEITSPEKIPEHYNPPRNPPEHQNLDLDKAGLQDLHEIPSPKKIPEDYSSPGNLIDLKTPEYPNPPGENVMHQDKEGLQDLQEKIPEDSNPPGGNLGDIDVDKAATKIQSQIRGYLTREKIYHEHPELEQHLKHQHHKHDDHDMIGPAKTPESPPEVVLQLDQPELDERATKIQAAYRGFQVRKHPDKYGLKPCDIKPRRASAENIHTAGRPEEGTSGGKIPRSSSHEGFSTPDLAATKIQAGIRGYLTRKHVHEMVEKETDAATKIQAQFRGFTTRKHMEEQGLLSPTRSTGSRSRTPTTPESTPEPPRRHSAEGPGTPHFETPGEAATKIQAEVRGFLTRKEIEKENQAAEKIQAAYKGFHVRKELDEQKNHVSYGEPVVTSLQKDNMMERPGHLESAALAVKDHLDDHVALMDHNEGVMTSLQKDHVTAGPGHVESTALAVKDLVDDYYMTHVDHEEGVMTSLQKDHMTEGPGHVQPAELGVRDHMDDHVTHMDHHEGVMTSVQKDHMTEGPGHAESAALGVIDHMDDHMTHIDHQEGVMTSLQKDHMTEGPGHVESAALGVKDQVDHVTGLQQAGEDRNQNQNVMLDYTDF